MQLFNLGYVISLVDHVSAPLKAVEARFDHLNKSVARTSNWRDVGMNMAAIGAGALVAGGAAAYALKSVLQPAIEMQGTMAHVATAMDDGADTAAHLNEVMRVTTELATRGVIDNTKLAEAYYLSRSNMLGHAASLDVVRASMLLVQGTTKDATEAQQNMGETTRMLSTLVHQFGGTADYWADKFAKLQTKYSFAGIGEVTAAMRYALPVMQEFKLDTDQTVAALAGLSAAGLHGEQAGTAFREFISKLGTGKKLHEFARQTKDGGLDIVASLEALGAGIASMPALEQGRFLKGLGFGLRDITGVALLSAVDKTRQVYEVAKDVHTATGAAAAASAKRLEAYDAQVGILRNSWSELKESIGSALLPAVTNLVPHITHLVNAMREFVEAHPGVTKLAVGFAALSAAILIPVGSLLIFVGGVIAAASYLPALGVMLSPLVSLFGALAGAVGSVAWSGMLAAFSGGGISGTIYALGAALASLVSWPVVVGAAIVAGGVMLYRHWETVAGFFSRTWAWLKGLDWSDVGLSLARTLGRGIGAGLVTIPFAIMAFAVAPILGLPGAVGAGLVALVGVVATYRTQIVALASSLLSSVIAGAQAFVAMWGNLWSQARDAVVAVFQRVVSTALGLGSQLYRAGVAMLQDFGRGIVDGMKWPIEAAQRLATRVKDMFVGHSPPPEGPLRELGRVRIVETIAEMMNPAPLLAASRAAAAAAAIVVPIAFAPVPGVAMPMPQNLIAPVSAPAVPMQWGVAAPVPTPSQRTQSKAATVHVTYSPTINVKGGISSDADFKKLLDEHATALVDRVKRAQERAERVSY